MLVSFTVSMSAKEWVCMTEGSLLTLAKQLGKLGDVAGF